MEMDSTTGGVPRCFVLLANYSVALDSQANPKAGFLVPSLSCLIEKMKTSHKEIANAFGQVEVDCSL